MAAPDPAVVERQFYIDLLRITDDGTLTLAELRSLTGGGAYAASSVQAADSRNVQGLGVSYIEYPAASGALVIDGRKTTHSITMVGNTDVTIANPVPGQTISIWAQGAFTLTVMGVTVPTREAVAVYIRGQWNVRFVGESQDSIPPTGGTLAVVVGNTTADLTVTGAMDNKALDAAPYAYRYGTTPDGGTTWNFNAWTAYQAGNTIQFTGLTGATMYKFEHRVKDSSGNVTFGLGVVKTTSNTPTWADIATWNFTAANDTEVNGLAFSSGANATLTAPASVPGASPPRLNNILTNKARNKYDGNNEDWFWLSTVAKARGLGFEGVFAVSAANNARLPALAVGTNSAGTNQIGFSIDHAGTVTAYHFAAGSTTYTEVDATPVPLNATLKCEFSKNPDGSCTGSLYVNGVLKGTVASSGWTWQGKHVMVRWNSNQTDSTLDDFRFFGAAV